VSFAALATRLGRSLRPFRKRNSPPLFSSMVEFSIPEKRMVPDESEKTDPEKIEAACGLKVNSKDTSETFKVAYASPEAAPS
jgi:hypothetical protein